MPGLPELSTLLPYANAIWTAILTVWTWKLSRRMRGKPEPERRSNGETTEVRDPVGKDGARTDQRQDRGLRPVPASGMGTVGLAAGVATAPTHWPPPAGLRRDPPEPLEKRPGSEASDRKASRLVSELNRLVSSYTPADQQAFEGEWAPVEVDSSEGDRLAAAPGGSLWFVRIEPEWGVILPGSDMVRNWEKFYRNLGGAGAPKALSASYALIEGPVLKVHTPAWGRIGSGGIQIHSQGQLAGV